MYVGRCVSIYISWSERLHVFFSLELNGHESYIWSLNKTTKVITAFVVYLVTESQYPTHLVLTVMGTALSLCSSLVILLRLSIQSLHVVSGCLHRP